MEAQQNTHIPAQSKSTSTPWGYNTTAEKSARGQEISKERTTFDIVGSGHILRSKSPHCLIYNLRNIPPNFLSVATEITAKYKPAIRQVRVMEERDLLFLNLANEEILQELLNNPPIINVRNK